MDAERHHEPDEPRAKAWGERLAYLRQSRGISQEALATGAGLDIDAVNEIERGVRAPTDAEIDRLARTLNVPPTALRPSSLVVIDSSTLDIKVLRPAEAPDGCVQRARPIGADEARADYERHFGVSAHFLARVARVTGLETLAARHSVVRVLTHVCETGWPGPSDSELTAIAELDSLGDAWDALKRPVPAWQFRSWFDQLGPGHEPVVVGLLLRDAAARAAAAKGVLGLRYSCQACRGMAVGEARRDALLDRIGRDEGDVTRLLWP